MKSCAKVERLRQWRDGRLGLTAAEEAELEVHVATCPQCSCLLQSDEQTEKWRQLLKGPTASSPQSAPVDGPMPQPGQAGILDHYLRRGFHSGPPGDGSLLHLNCPHCRNPIEVVGAMPANEVLCPSCGSRFHLDGGTSALSTPEVGRQVLGKFHLLHVVGAGAFGTVYKARDPELDRTVAIKLPRAGNLRGEHDRFLREARTVAQLRHPHIVPVFEAGQFDGLSYLVSEFVEGITLEDQLKLRRPTPQEAAGLMAAVADALHYSHGQGVVHRDLKPSNIMLDAEGRPRVMDFGMAKRDAGEITMTVEGQVLGTPAYMSPEQAKGEGHAVDGRSDVYSLGVILYELLTGEIPFRGNSRMLLHQVLHDDPKPPRQLNDHIARDLETVCLKAMAKEPPRRYQSAGELRDDLTRFMQGEPIEARPVGGLERLLRWARRNPRVATLSAAVLILLLAVSAGSAVVAALVEERRETAETRSAFLDKLLELYAELQPEPVFEEPPDKGLRVAGVRVADDFASKIEELRQFLDKKGTEEDRLRFQGMLGLRLGMAFNALQEQFTLPCAIVRVTGTGDDGKKPFEELTVERLGGRIRLNNLEELERELKKLRNEEERVVSESHDRNVSFVSRVDVRFDDRVSASVLLDVVRACRCAGPWSVAIVPLRNDPSGLDMPLGERDVTPFEMKPLPPAEVELPVGEGASRAPTFLGPEDLREIPGVPGGSLGDGLGDPGRGRGLPRAGSKQRLSDGR